MLEFKLNYYFELLKDTPAVSASRFKDEFVRKYGKFELLNELVIMIQRYQLNKYGNLLESGNFILRKRKKNIFNDMEISRNLRIFGTKEERLKRKLEEKYARK